MTKTRSGDNQSVPTTGTYAMRSSSLSPPRTRANPWTGGQVTFTIVPNARGAGATFGTCAGCTLGNGNLTAVCTISGGKATSPPLTAKDTAGSVQRHRRRDRRADADVHLTSIAVTLGRE